MLQKKLSSLKREHLALQNFTFVGYFALLDPDPDPADQNECRSGSATLPITDLALGDG
jgi:hypothetical protein